MEQKLLQFVCIIGTLLLFGSYRMQSQQNALGEGFYAPKTDKIETLYLYDIPNSRAGTQVRATDSITFTSRNGNYADGIGYAPDGFQPYHEKLDYGVFLLRVKKLGADYSEVFINENTGETAYVNSFQGTFLTWGQFLLNCHSVEFVDTNQKTFDHPYITSAGRTANPPYFKVRYVQGDWMEVFLLTSNYEPTGQKAWIRWRKDGKLLILYNLFS